MLKNILDKKSTDFGDQFAKYFFETDHYLCIISILDISLTVQQNNNTFRFSSLVYVLCVNLFAFFDTQNPEISGFSTAHAYKYKTKRQANIKRRQQKNDIFVD